MDSSFFASNRVSLLEQLGDGPPVVVVGHGYMQMSRDTEFPFEQDRNFFYLCGVDDADWVLVIEAEREYLIAPKLSEIEQIFNGVANFEGIVKTSGITEVVENDEGWKRLKKHTKIRSIATPMQREGSVFTNPASRLFFDKLNAQVEDITETLLTLRTVKQPQEIKQIRQAVELTGEAFSSAAEILNTLESEAQLEGVFSGHFASNSSKHAYSPIVAAGANACTLHYTSNSSSLAEKGLVLVDIGAKTNNYAADITRTWKLEGASERHVEVVEVVKSAFDEILKIIKPKLAFSDYQSAVDSIMTDSLGKLGLENDEESLRKYFPHAPSHGLGLDVHDPIVGYSKLVPGMVLTLEPGIYIPEEYIGVRYEDDLLVTESGVENLSGDIK